MILEIECKYIPAVALVLRVDTDYVLYEVGTEFY